MHLDFGVKRGGVDGVLEVNGPITKTKWEENRTGAAADQRYGVEFGMHDDDEDGIFQDPSIQSFQHGFWEAMGS